MIPDVQTGDTAALSALLRPRTIGDILDATIRLYRRYFLLYFCIVIIMQAVVFIVGQGFQIPFYLLNKEFQLAIAEGDFAARLPELLPLAIPAAVGFVVLILVSMVAYQFTTGGLVVAVSDTFLGHPIRIADAYRAVLARFWSLIGAGLLSSLLSFAVLLAGGVAFALCMIGGELLGGGVLTLLGALVGAGFVFAAFICTLYLFLSFLLAPQAVMLEDASAVEALRRSWELMWRRSERGLFRNNLFRAAIILLIVGLLKVAVVMLVQIPVIIVAVLLAVQSDGGAVGAGGMMPLWLQVPSQLLQTTAGALVMPISIVALILFYYDIRIRFEGFDLQVLASAIEAR